MIWLYPSLLFVFIFIIIAVELLAFISEVFSIKPLKQWLMFGAFLIAFFFVMTGIL